MNSNPVDSTYQGDQQSQVTSGQEEDNPEKELDIRLTSQNIAEDLEEDQLTHLANECKTAFEADLKSRQEWDDALEAWVKIAKQEREAKNYPWPKSSNVKYPLLSTAAMQFAARSYPSLVPSNGKIVKSVVLGKDATGEKLEKADRISTYMSYQLMYEMECWEEEMDKLLMQLPIVGTMFKKTYFDKAHDRICSKLVQPENLIVNYWAKNLDECERISERIYMSKRLVKERQNQGIFLDIDLGETPLPIKNDHNENIPPIDDTTPYELIEQHTFLDLKDTGYALPYIVTFERTTGKILRIQNRYYSDDVETDEKGKIIKIKPIQMYTKFGFVPNPDGSFYDIGFGVLLGPLNESVNTIINQLVDAGTLSNLQSGFIGKGLRIRQGDQTFMPGEWKPVNATGDDLRKQIVPLPAKEPSKTLFELMGALITSGKELASVAEIFVGKMPGQNTPATTTMASIEQGMKVFTAVYKRIFRSLEQEFKKIYKLNSLYLDPQTYVNVLDEPIGPDDFNIENYDVCPGADPTAVSQTEKLLKAQGLVELMQIAPQAFNVIEVLSRVLEAQEQPNWQRVFSQEVQQSGQLPPAPPDPKLMAIQQKAQADQAKTATDLQAKQMEMELSGREKMMQMQMQQQEHAQKMEMQKQETMQKAASELAMARIFASTEQMKGQQQLQQGEQAHQQKMAQQKEQLSLQKQKQQMSTKNGSPTRSPSNSKKT